MNRKDLLTMNISKHNRILIKIVLIELKRLDRQVNLDSIKMLKIIKI